MNTDGFMMFTDAQGCQTTKSGGWMLTDPAMVCKDLTRFGPTNGPLFLEMSYEGVQHVLETTRSISDPGKSGGTSYVPGFTAKVSSSAYDAAKSGYLSRRKRADRERAAAKLRKKRELKDAADRATADRARAAPTPRCVYCGLTTKLKHFDTSTPYVPGDQGTDRLVCDKLGCMFPKWGGSTDHPFYADPNAH